MSVLQQFFWCADHRRFEARCGAHVRDAVSHRCVRDVPTIPGQEVVHSVSSGHRNMQCVFGCLARDRRLRHETCRQDGCGLGHLQPRYASQRNQPLRRRLGVPGGRLIDDEPRDIEFEADGFWKNPSRASPTLSRSQAPGRTDSDAQRP